MAIVLYLFDRLFILATDFLKLVSSDVNLSQAKPTFQLFQYVFGTLLDDNHTCAGSVGHMSCFYLFRKRITCDMCETRGSPSTYSLKITLLEQGEQLLRPHLSMVKSRNR